MICKLTGYGGLPARENLSAAGGGVPSFKMILFFPGSWFRVSGFGFRVSGFEFWVSGFGFRISGFGLRVSGFGFRVLRRRFIQRGELRFVTWKAGGVGVWGMKCAVWGLGFGV